MFFPIRTDRRLQNTPWVNYILIAANIVIFLLPSTNPELVNRIRMQYMLFPNDPQLHQFLSYQFLHSSIGHILGNMLFLFVFGNGAEDRLGKIGYLAFYLAGGVLAGLGHCLVDVNPVLGASGSVAAVTGTYLVLFPLSNVTIVYWFFFIGAFEVSSMVLILFQIGVNIVFHLLGASDVAYMAHLAGYAFGIAIAAGLLWVRILPREPYDLLALIEQKRRQLQFRRITRDGYQPWDHAKAGQPSRKKKADTPKLSAEDEKLIDLRRSISDAVGDRNIGHAAKLYTDLLEIDGGQVMNQQQQLDIANQLMSDGRYDTAAQAYELFLNTFKGYTQREQVELILGLIYVRYLERRQRGRELLNTAMPRLHDKQQRQLAQSMLDQFE